MRRALLLALCLLLPGVSQAGEGSGDPAADAPATETADAGVEGSTEEARAAATDDEEMYPDEPPGPETGVMDPELGGTAEDTGSPEPAEAVPAGRSPLPAATFSRRLLLEGGVMFGAAAVTVPVTAWVATLLGRSTPNLLLAALPSLLTFILVPPVLITMAGVWAARKLVGEQATWHQPAIYLAAGVQLIAVVVAIVMGGRVAAPLDLTLLALVDAVLVSGTIFATFELQRDDPPKSAAALTLGPRLRDPRPALTLPLGRLSFW